MINSRDISELHPSTRARCERFLKECKAQDIDVLITSTYRDADSQNALYAEGRTKPGSIRTNARGGQSFHNFRCAFDVVPLRNGRLPVWGTKGNGLDDDPTDDDTDDLELWQRVGAIGESVGLEWAGRWKGKLREMAHFQYSGGLKIADLQAAKTFV